MLYLIDGYNVTKADPATRALSLEAQRDALTARVGVRGRDLLGQGRAVIVFDGSGDYGMSREPSGDVEVRFSRGESADDLVVRLAGGSSKSVCLVSSDSGLAERVRAVAGGSGRVEVRSRETLFEGAASRARRRKGTPYPASSAGIPAGGNRITEELKALWLTGEDATEHEDEE